MSHDHTHATVEPSAGGKIESKFGLALALTGLILVAEIIGGLWTGSLALLSDAAHVFLDMFALGLGYGAIRLAALPASDRHTYGFHRMKVIAAFINGATLLLVAFEIFREAWTRFQNPEPILAGPMLGVAVIGLGVNLAVTFVLREHDHDDLNTRAAFLHVLGDTLSSVGVIAAGVVILFTGWLWVDPLVSVLIALVILSGAGRVLKQTIHILNEGAPEGVDVTELGQAMQQVAGVDEVHDLHVWTVSPGYAALSAHVVLADQALSQTGPVMAELKETIYHRFGIEHTTIQFECHNCGQGGVVCLSPAAAEVAAMTFYLISAAIVFIFSGLLAMAGLGAAFLFVPLFYYLGVPLAEATATALLLNTVSLLFATVNYWRGQLVNWRVGLPVLITAVILSPVGAWLTPYVDKTLLLGLFAAFLVFAGAMMLFYQARSRQRPLSRVVEVGAGTGVGSAAGFLGGLLGVGGGNFILPVLNWLGLETKVAAGTTALIVVFSSFSGFLGHATLGGLDPFFIGLTAIMAAAGSIAGSQLMKTKLSNTQLKRIIGLLLWLIAAKMIFDLFK